jgi:hypothetical protein
MVRSRIKPEKKWLLNQSKSQKKEKKANILSTVAQLTLSMDFCQKIIILKRLFAIKDIFFHWQKVSIFKDICIH